MSEAQWTRVAHVADISPDAPKVVRPSGHQIVIFDTGESLHACNNRCPHEGYPLSEGHLADGCVLTCNWHNWKFSLDSGANLLGGDSLRVYPLEVRGEDVYLDLSPPSAEERRLNAYRNFDDAFDDNDYARMARETARLRLAGETYDAVVTHAIARALPRMEFGWTHALPGAAEWLDLVDAFAGDDDATLTCALEAVAHLADDVLREPEYPFPCDRKPWNEDAFVADVEAEDEASAIGRVDDALASGLEWSDLERGFARAALAHYQDFGHSLIYVRMAGPLCERLGRVVLGPLLRSLTRSLVFARREDLVPEFRGYADALARFADGAESGALPEPDTLKKQSVQRALDAVVGASGAPAEAVHAVLTVTAAIQLLGFDLAQQARTDGNIADNTSWLDLTHGITFAEAAIDVCTRYPQLWAPALLQLACFIGRNRGFVGEDEHANKWVAIDSFFATEKRALLDHGCTEFIESVHRLKTLLATERLVERTDDSHGRHVLQAAVNRYLHSPLKLKHARRTARQAARFVALDG